MQKLKLLRNPKLLRNCNLLENAIIKAPSLDQAFVANNKENHKYVAIRCKSGYYIFAYA